MPKTSDSAIVSPDAAHRVGVHRVDPMNAPAEQSRATVSADAVPTTMCAVHLTGHGGYAMLDYRTDVPTPSAGPGEVLIQVGAAGVNNTDVNTRIGWYSKSVTAGTNDGGDGFANDTTDDAAWTGSPLELPRIQGADCCGRILAVGSGVDATRIGERVVVRSMQGGRNPNEPMEPFTFGSECDGGFAQFTTARSHDALRVDSDWTDVELASLPCAYSTAEGMLHRANVAGGRVLITGASGGVGSALVQLAKRRGCEVVAVAGAAKFDQVRRLGADQLVARDADLLAELGAGSIDVALDVVAGPGFGALLDVLRIGGTYVTVGAIAGPIVELDVRTLYLHDLTLMGCTFQPDVVFENLVSYVEANEIRPLVAATYPLHQIAEAQRRFLRKEFVGKLVLIPPAIGPA